MEPWLVQLRHHGLSITGGKRYTISFAAKASNARSIDVLLQKSGVSSVKEYSKQQPKLTTLWTRYTYIYVADTTVDNVTLAFNVAETTGHVWLDDVWVTTP